MQKIRWKWLWFLLLAAPLLLTPVQETNPKGGVYYKGLAVGPSLALPINGTIGFGWRIRSLYRDRPAHPLHWTGWRENPKYLFVDWGRICYWWAWVVAVALLFHWEPFRNISRPSFLSRSANEQKNNLGKDLIHE